MKTIYGAYCKAEEAACCVAFFSIVVLVFGSAIARGFNHPIPWSIDISQLLLAWVSFFGADIAFRYNQLVGIDLFTRKLPTKLKRLVELTIFLLIILALAILIVYGIKLCIGSYKRSFQTLPISYSLVTASLPLAATSMLVTVTLKVKNVILGFSSSDNPNARVG